MKDNPGFCYDIYKNQAFWNYADGSVVFTPCSVYKGVVDKNLSPDQSWKGENRKTLISIVEQGKTISGCQPCYQTEAQGLRSRRQADQEHYELFLNDLEINADASGPTSLDYSVGNLCNLKCVICGPHQSTTWVPDYQKLYPDADISRYLYRKNHIHEIKDSTFLQNIKSIHFHGGGEPLMSDAHLELLRRVQKVKGLGDVRVYYNTNGTKQVTDEVLEIWSQCRLIELYFSIDDIAHRFEYQRTNARWSDLLNNIEWFKVNMPHNHMFNINCVWSYLNLYYLDELWQWHEVTLPFNRHGDPCRLIFQKAIGPFQVKHLSVLALETLLKKFSGKQALLSLLKNIICDDGDHAIFWEAVNKIDSVRGHNFREICPEWSAWL